MSGVRIVLLGTALHRRECRLVELIITRSEHGGSPAAYTRGRRVLLAHHHSAVP
jgi:hypothetical protein